MCRGGACVCVCVGGVINTRKSTSYDIRLSIYYDGVRPVEMKRRLEVVENLTSSVNRII